MIHEKPKHIAYGFGLIKGFIEVHATLMNKKLQTPTISANNNDLKFASEIVWYMDSATLKKLKMSCASVRVECIHKQTNTSCSNHRLGYLLLKVKEAQTINPESNDRIENKTYKLIGTKNCSYSLIMSLRIEDFNEKSTEISAPNLNKEMKSINDKNITNNDNFSQKVEEICQGKNDGNESIENDLPKDDVNISEQTGHVYKKDEPQKVFNFDVQQKLIEELEDWKEKQKILFNEKIKIKEEQYLKEYYNKWLDERISIDEALSNEISKSKTLAENMDKTADNLIKREAIITAKEKELALLKDSTDNKYIGLVQNVQNSNAQTINDLTNHIFYLKTKLHDLEETNVLLKRENEQLKYDIDINCGPHKEQLKKKILNLESKCEEANKSSMFYKERWIASLRRINQIYTELHEIKTNQHLFNHRQNIKNIMAGQIVEGNHDREKLRQLLNDLGKLREDMTNNNYFDP